MVGFFSVCILRVREEKEKAYNKLVLIPHLNGFVGHIGTIQLLCTCTHMYINMRIFFTHYLLVYPKGCIYFP